MAATRLHIFFIINFHDNSINLREKKEKNCNNFIKIDCDHLCTHIMCTTHLHFDSNFFSTTAVAVAVAVAAAAHCWCGSILC